MKPRRFPLPGHVSAGPNNNSNNINDANNSVVVVDGGGVAAAAAAVVVVVVVVVVGVGVAIGVAIVVAVVLIPSILLSHVAGCACTRRASCPHPARSSCCKGQNANDSRNTTTDACQRAI